MYLLEDLQYLEHGMLLKRFRRADPLNQGEAKATMV